MGYDYFEKTALDKARFTEKDFFRACHGQCLTYIRTSIYGSM